MTQTPYTGTEFAVEGRIPSFNELLVRPTTEVVQQKSSLDTIAQTLTDLNPALNAMFNNQINQRIKEEKQKGFNLAVRQNRREGGFKTVVDELRRNQDDGATNRFIAGSIFAQDAFNETRASLLAARAPREIEALYNTTTIESPVIDQSGFPVLDGNGDPVTENRPLYEFSTSSEQYRNFAEQVQAIGDAEYRFI